MTLKLQNKEVLVTGGTGQIGSFLVEELVKEGSNVTVIGRNEKRLNEISPLLLSHKIKFLKADLTNEKSVKRIASSLKQTQFFVHLSSETSNPYPTLLKNARYLMDLELKGLINLLRPMKELDGILFSSSMAVFGRPKYQPVDEKCPMCPVSFYGCAKIGAEKFLKLYSKAEDVPLTILRYSSVYGPRSRNNRSIPQFIKNSLENKSIRLLGKGKGFRDFIYISDVIKITMQAIKKNTTDEYNIGSGIKCSMLKLAKTIIKLSSSKSRIILSNKPHNFDLVFDISKAQKNFKFQPAVPLAKGLKKELEWHERQGI